MIGAYRVWVELNKYWAKRNFNDPDGWGYYREYDHWIPKLRIDKSKQLKILDIGCDINQSLKKYLEYKNYKIEKYVGYDVLLNTPFKRENIFEFYGDYNFIKMDCEGCEYEIFGDVPEDKIAKLLDHEYVAVGLHRGGQFERKFDDRVYRAITSILPHKVFVVDNGDMTEVEEVWTR